MKHAIPEDGLSYLPRSIEGWRQLASAAALLAVALALLGKEIIGLARRRPSEALYILAGIKK